MVLRILVLFFTIPHHQNLRPKLWFIGWVNTQYRGALILKMPACSKISSSPVWNTSPAAAYKPAGACQRIDRDSPPGLLPFPALSPPGSLMFFRYITAPFDSGRFTGWTEETSEITPHHYLVDKRRYLWLFQRYGKCGQTYDSVRCNKIRSIYFASQAS